MPAFVKPPVDIIEEKDRYIVVMDLPGVQPEDIEITGYDNYLEITGIKRPVSTGNYILMERFSGKFKRRVFFKGEIDTTNASATLKDGVLTIHIPKSTGKIMISTTTIIIRR